MIYCYNCESPLNQINQSIEHIIPNSVGGRLKSKKLLCNSCNKRLGEEIDVEIGRQLNPFMNFFLIDRERGKYNPLKGKTNNGEEFILDGIEVKSKPKISVNDNGVSFNGNDEQDVKNYLKGILKKHPYLKIDEIIEKANKGKYYLNEPININMNFGGEKALRAITKIMVNFYLFNNGNKEYASNLIQYMNGSINNGEIWYNYEFENDKLVITKGNVYHFLKIEGNPHEKILYGYIELFGTHKFLLLFSNNYVGEQFSKQYFFNLLNKEVVTDEINLNYSSQDINHILNIKNNTYLIDKIQSQIQHTLNVSQMLQRNLIVNKLIKESINEIFGKEKDTEITEELLDRFIDDISYKMAVFLSRNEDPKNKTYF